MQTRVTNMQYVYIPSVDLDNLKYKSRRAN